MCVLCPQFIGAIYTFSAGGVSLPEPRRVFLDAAEPAKLVMRVPQSTDDEDKVVSYYSWSRSKPHHYTYYWYMVLAPSCAGIHMYVIACSPLQTFPHLVNFVYRNKKRFGKIIIFQLFTPANLGTHGATVTDGVPLFTVS